MPTTTPEPLLTVAEAAAKLNLKTWIVQRAVKRGIVPSYRILNSRRRVRLSEVIEVIDSSRIGEDEANPRPSELNTLAASDSRQEVNRG